ncbi:MAG: 4Fe-4S dicluster domain-containing protein [Lysobacteraceae bacterium]
MSKTIESTLIDDHPGFYEAEAKVYPRSVKGRFQRLRVLAVFWLLGMYYLFPWLSWDGRQAVLFDLPARKFYIFGLNFWPQDFFFLAMLLMMAGLSLFFFTALAGRLWCGYACPQTVWTEAFLWMERWTEGDRPQRMKLDAAPWSWNKLRRKGSKHVIWLVFALWTGFTFVGFFTPIRDLGARLYPFGWGGWETFWVLFYSLATWGNAGVLREQVCKYMCPYARFQGAMFDRNTLIIAYDPMRGEPRGPRKRGLASVLERARGLLPQSRAEAEVVNAYRRGLGKHRALQARASTGLVDLDSPLRHDEALIDDTAPSSPDALGDCIDCTICVQVCPTGIDIRNGLQYECIACGACIDACDDVMDRIGYPRGLVRYTTQNAVDGRPRHILRPRVIVYGLLLCALLGAWTWGVLNRAPLIVDILRDRNALYRETADGIENVYTLKLVNKTQAAQSYRIEVIGDPAIRLVNAPSPLRLDPESIHSLTLNLRVDEGRLHGRQPIRLRIRDASSGQLLQEVENAFFAPGEPR